MPKILVNKAEIVGILGKLGIEARQVTRVVVDLEINHPARMYVLSKEYTKFEGYDWLKDLIASAEWQITEVTEDTATSVGGDAPDTISGLRQELTEAREELAAAVALVNAALPPDEVSTALTVETSLLGDTATGEDGDDDDGGE